MKNVDLDVSEILGLLLLGGIAVGAILKGDMGIANTVVGVLGGYMTKAVKAPASGEKGT